MLRLLSAPALLAALGLAACTEADLERIPPGPPPSPLPSDPAFLTLELNATPEEARPVVEEIAARCWLDGVVGAGTMLVDRDTGQILMSGETEDLLVVDFLPTTDLARMRLSGPVMADRAKQERLLMPLSTYDRTGEIECPPPMTG